MAEQKLSRSPYSSVVSAGLAWIVVSWLVILDITLVIARTL
jgi:hypothetical protein